MHSTDCKQFETPGSISMHNKLAVIILGGLCLIPVSMNLPEAVSSWSFLTLLAFALLVTARVSIRLPHTKFTLGFSDAVVFLCFILYDGSTAVLLATLENLANCLYLRRKDSSLGRLTILFSVSSTTLSTTLTYAAWLVFLQYAHIDLRIATTTELISALGFLAITQFFTSSVVISIFSALLTEKSFWSIWKKNCFANSLPPIIGAVLVGIFYNLIYYADFLTATIVGLVFAVTYINYRQTIKNIGESVAQAQQAELEKTEFAGLTADAAKTHAAELELLLAKEERASEDLLHNQNALEHAAFHDFLTDLPNRTYLIERLDLLIEIGIETSHKYYVLFLDLHRFKNINDTLGHSVGDRVLKLVGKRLQRIVRREDTVARLGGDEFAIILKDLSSVEEAEIIARQIYAKLSSPFLINGNKVFSDLHIGIAPFDAEHKKPGDILRDADIAMHHAKTSSCGIAVFDKDLRARYLEKITLEADLWFAVERGELSLYYQPLVSLKDGELVGFEALLRWHHHQKGFISPAKFIPIAEDSGLIIPITKWILRQTCFQLAEWQKISPIYSKLLVSVNISGKHLSDEDLITDVRQALKGADLTPASLKLEITESAAMDNAEMSIKILKGLKNLGIRLSIDDFGTGYSSLSYLHRLPFDALKIDRSFVFAVGEHGEHSEILQTIVSLAQNLKMWTFAEGIETYTQLTVLQNLGCDYGQGYLMSKPLPKDEMEQALRQKRQWLPIISTHYSNQIEDDLPEQSLLIF